VRILVLKEQPHSQSGFLKLQILDFDLKKIKNHILALFKEYALEPLYNG